MIKTLYGIPKLWLTLEDCAHIFETSRKNLGFDELIPPFETRFRSKLESILASVEQTFGRQYLNQTVLDASAAYFNQIIRGHPFRNGNKRMAVLFTHIFLLIHGIDFNLRYNELYHFAVFVARASEQGISSERTKEWCKMIIAEFTKERQ